MKFIERVVLMVYSYIVLLLAVMLCLLVFRWVSLTDVTNIIENIVTGETTSKITLIVSAICMLLSIRCIFFDSHSKEVIKESQGILLKNDNGQLLITKETLDNMVKSVVYGFDSIKECLPKISVNENNEISITLQIVIEDNVILKDLASNLQSRVKEELKKTSDLDVKEVNIKVVNLNKNERNTKAE